MKIIPAVSLKRRAAAGNSRHILAINKLSVSLKQLRLTAINPSGQTQQNTNGVFDVM